MNPIRGNNAGVFTVDSHFKWTRVVGLAFITKLNLRQEGLRMAGANH
jgi:hypothetical protein